MAPNKPPKRGRGRPKGTTKAVLHDRQVAKERVAAEAAAREETARAARPKGTGGTPVPPPPALWQPTQAQRDAIKVLRANGETIEVIARVIGVAPQTLTARCRDELDNGAGEIRSKMGATLVQRALAGSNQCLIHWLNTRGGPEWKRINDDAAPLSDVVALFRTLAEQARVEADGRAPQGRDEVLAGRGSAAPVQH